MENNSLFEEKVIEVGDNTLYYVVKQTLYNGKIYLFANELKDENTPTEYMAILRVDNNDDKIIIAMEKDDNVINPLIEIFSNLLEK